MIHFNNNDLVCESIHGHAFKIMLLTDMMNVDFQQFGIFGKYLSRDEMNAKSYGHNSPREFNCGKPEISGCKLWSVCGTGGHCFIHKAGRYGNSKCMAYL